MGPKGGAWEEGAIPGNRDQGNFSSSPLGLESMCVLSLSQGIYATLYEK